MFGTKLKVAAGVLGYREKEPAMSQRAHSRRLLTSAAVTVIVALVGTLVASMVAASPAAASEYGSTRTEFRDVRDGVYGESTFLNVVVIDTSTSCETFGDCDGPHGTVEFHEGSTWLGSFTRSDVGGGDRQTYFMHVCCADVGAHTITASFEFDGQWDRSSAQAQFIVEPRRTTGSVVQSSETSAPGTPVTFTATAVGATGEGYGDPDPRAARPSGQLRLYDGLTEIGPCRPRERDRELHDVEPGPR